MDSKLTIYPVHLIFIPCVHQPQAGIYVCLIYRDAFCPFVCVVYVQAFVRCMCMCVRALKALIVKGSLV